jgi:two-component system, LytTR family, response regulator
VEAAMNYLAKRVNPTLGSAVLQEISSTPKIIGSVFQPVAGFKRILIQEGENCWIVRVADLMLLESEGNCTRVHFGKNRPMMTRSLNYIEKRLDPCMFFRANRHSIINLQHVECIEPWVNGGFLVRLHSGPEIVVSRRRGRLLREKMTL